MEGKPRDGFEAEFARVVAEARGLLHLLKSVKDGLGERMRDDRLYRMTLKRLRDDGIRLSAYATAYALLAGERERDSLLSGNGCSWDAAKRRVDLG